MKFKIGKPLSLKKKTIKNNNTTKRQCIIHYSSVSSKIEIKELTVPSWQKIQSILEQRVCKSSSYSTFDEICDGLPSVPDYTRHGFHRDCYKRFTNIKTVNSRKRKLTFTNSCENIPEKKRHPSGDKVLFPQNECIICEKKR